MMIVGCDYHPGFQQIAYVNTDKGELPERRLGHKAEVRAVLLRTHVADPTQTEDE
jgi:hypothetical protein